jgi:c-di-GMP-binding flagellar brake protein YcgR
LFWKKKKKDEKKELFTFEDNDSRELVRVRPADDKAVSITFGPQTTTLYEISAGGLAIPCGQAQIGGRYAVVFQLPGESVVIRAEVEVVRATEGKVRICGCRFVDLKPEMIEAIHHYILCMQKLELRKRKAES